MQERRILLNNNKVPEGAVDLGLPSGTIWSTFNVGATKPEEFGGYYSWGETKEKDNYNWETYNLARKNPNSLLKYCTSSEFGRIDNKVIIESADDTAYIRWGEQYRMPTQQEALELIEYCSIKSVVINNINCFELTGPNRNKLIFPKTGFYDNIRLKNQQCVYFWTNSISDTNNQKAFLTLLSEDNTISVIPNDRSYGCSIRPVLAVSWSIEGETLTTTNGKLDQETLEISVGTVENEILNL